MFTVNPGISAHDMKSVWETSLEEAMDNPGTEVTIWFAPGIYPLPDPGDFVYKEIPTPLHVKPPGSEAVFTYDPQTTSFHIRVTPRRAA